MPPPIFEPWRSRTDDYLLRVRQDFLASHLESIAAVASMRNGEKYSYDEESRRVYGFVAPSFPVEHYDAVLAEIEELLPGDGELHQRIYDFNLQFRVPDESVEAMIRAGIRRVSQSGLGSIHAAACGRGICGGNGQRQSLGCL